MRLNKKLIEIISFNIINQLKEKEFIDVKNIEEATELVEKIITEELSIEDKLDEEVRKILSEHMNLLQKEDIDYHEAFKRIKAKLAKDRNIIL